MKTFERVCNLDDELQAQLVEMVLTERGIPHIIRSYYDAAYDGIFQTVKGWGHLEAPRSSHEDVLAAMEEIRQQPAISEEDIVETYEI